MEERRDIPGYEGCYQVSDLGGVRSLDRRVRTVSRHGTESTRFAKGQPVRPQKHSCGYAQMYLNGHTRLVHQLVMLTFVGPCPEGMEVAHRDGNPANSALYNLRYDTPLGNANDRRLHGTSGVGEQNAFAKLSLEDVRTIRAIGRSARQVDTAAQFGTTQSNVSSIVCRTTWTDA